MGAEPWTVEQLSDGETTGVKVNSSIGPRDYLILLSFVGAVLLTPASFFLTSVLKDIRQLKSDCQKLQIKIAVLEMHFSDYETELQNQIDRCKQESSQLLR